MLNLEKKNFRMPKRRADAGSNVASAAAEPARDVAMNIKVEGKGKGPLRVARGGKQKRRRKGRSDGPEVDDDTGGTEAIWHPVRPLAIFDCKAPPCIICPASPRVSCRGCPFWCLPSSPAHQRVGPNFVPLK